MKDGQTLLLPRLCWSERSYRLKDLRGCESHLLSDGYPAIMVIPCGNILLEFALTICILVENWLDMVIMVKLVCLGGWSKSNPFHEKELRSDCSCVPTGHQREQPADFSKRSPRAALQPCFGVHFSTVSVQSEQVIQLVDEFKHVCSIWMCIF